MPLPLVLGGKSVSAQTLPGPCGRPDESDDGVLLEPLELYQTLGWGVCPMGEWLVRVTCSYYDLIDPSTGARDCTMVEVRIQVSPMTRPLSLDYRETEHHLKLFDGAQDIYPQIQPQVVVSSDRRNLAVLLFHPHQQSSALVIFQLRKPRSDLATAVINPIPVPAYIQKVGNEDAKEASLHHRDPPAVATHPRFVSVWGISTLCCLPPNVNPSVFVAACHDGSLVWLDARSSMAVATGHLDFSPQEQQAYLPFSIMRAAPSSEMNLGQVLLITANGKVLLVHWNVESTTKVQQTFLKRASTGMVVTESSLQTPLSNMSVQHQQPPQPSSSPRQQQGHKSPPARSKSNDLLDAFSPMRGIFRLPARSVSNVSAKEGAKSTGGFELKLPFQQNANAAKGDDESTKASSSTKRQHMDEFVLKELQKRTLSSTISSVTSNTTRSTDVSVESASPNATPRPGLSPLLQQVLHAQQEQQKQLQQQQQRHRRRHSELEGARAVDTLKRQMKLQVLASVGGVGVNSNDPAVVVDAQFATLPSMVCLLFEPDPLTRRVAQMYSISEEGTFLPLLSLKLSKEQLDEAFKVHSSRDHGAASAKMSGSITSPQGTSTSLESRQGLDHDAVSDTFAISTLIYGDGAAGEEGRWVGCLWNWRSNALSWTIQQAASPHSLWTRLYFAKHPQQGDQLAFVECHQDKYLHVRKQLVAMGLLSPSSCLVEGGVPLEANSLLLTSDSVQFPEASQPLESDVLELDWKVSTLPLNYRNMYGPPKIAASGRQHGSSIAIASSNGVCVLDRNFKWMQFGTPSEERSFQVVAMTWWEGQQDSRISSVGPEDVTEDLLVAIIQSNNGRQYLSCWSPKRLDLAHQLLETTDSQPSTNDNEPSEYSWGIPLVKDVKSTSLSLLAEPYLSSTHTKRRAVVLVSATNAATCDMEYSCYRLQVSKPTTGSALPADSYHELKPYIVVVEHTMHGMLKNGARSVSPISSVFLAGASFDFDLTKKAEETNESMEETIATLGVVRSPGGIEAVNLSRNNKAYVASVSNEAEVSKLSLADIICGSNLQSSRDGESHPIDAFVWTIEFLNGEILCWTVPYRLRGTDDVERQMASFLRGIEIARPKGLDPPTLVCKKESREKRKRYMLGVLCHIGRSSDWMLQSSSGTQSDITLGLVPDSGFGCVLRAGQHARTLHRSGVGGDFDTELFASDFLESEVYGPGEFLMMPPVFVPSLYMLLLEAAHLRTELPVIEESKIDATSELAYDEKERLLTIEKHIDFRLSECRNQDAAMMALRLLILRSVEMLSQVDKKHRKAQTDVSRSNLMLSLALFTEIVDVVRRCTSNLQFASLFLEVGRQIEPSFLAHLFPLPQSHCPSPASPTARRRVSNTFVADKTSLDRFNARTVVELFSLCVHEGSLSASASALPLLSSRMQSRSFCDLLLQRAIDAFCRNIDSTEADFDRTLEERRVIGDIFRFGIKLEDAAKLEERMIAQDWRDEQEGFAGQLTEDGAPPLEFHRAHSAESFTTDDSNSDNFNRQSSHRNLICVGGGSRQSTILGYVINSIFDDGAKESEDAIRRAASSFIDSKRDLASMDFLSFGTEEAGSVSEETPKDDQGEEDNSSESGEPPSPPKRKSSKLPSPSDDPPPKSVACLVGSMLLELVKTPEIDHPWKAVACLSRLLLQQAKEMPPLDVYTKAVEQTSKAALESVLPTGYQEEPSDAVVRFLVAEIGRCEFQIQRPAQEPAWIVELVLVLLHRLQSSADDAPPEVVACLVLLGLIAGHASGRAVDLLEAIDKGSSNYLVKCYKSVQQDIAGSSSA